MQRKYRCTENVSGVVFVVNPLERKGSKLNIEYDYSLKFTAFLIITRTPNFLKLI